MGFKEGQHTLLILLGREIAGAVSGTRRRASIPAMDGRTGQFATTVVHQAEVIIRVPTKSDAKTSRSRVTTKENETLTVTAAGASLGSTSKSPRGSAPRKPAAPRRAPERSVCVYCGSGLGTNPAYAEAARKLGQDLATAGLGLVYGGGSLGLMGEVARATLAAGGHVTGIIPGFLTDREQMLKDVNDLIVTRDMHERKKLMFERSSAFVALPGGVGTLEELVEQLTWSQLGQHDKPIIVANVARFWDPFLDLLAHMKSDAFIRAGIDVRFTVVDEASKVVPVLMAHFAKQTDIDPSLGVLANF